MSQTPPPLAPQLNARLSTMMFLQYAIWGAWLPLFFPFLVEHRGFEPEQAGTLFAIAAIGALVAPFIAGQIADRWFNTEKFLAISHLLGAFLVWQLANVTEYSEFVIYGLLYSLVYAPTLPLTNSLAFHHVPDRDRDFSKVRVWGTVGWIAVGIGVGQWLLHSHTPAAGTEAAVRAAQVAGMADAFKVSAVLGVIPRFPLTSSFTRWYGTRMPSARSRCVRSSGSRNSRRSISPGMFSGASATGAIRRIRS